MGYRRDKTSEMPSQGVATRVKKESKANSCTYCAFYDIRFPSRIKYLRNVSRYNSEKDTGHIHQKVKKK